MKIPFNRPYVTGKEAGYIQDVIERGHSSGDGLYTKKCHQILETVLIGSKVLLTTSCTHALEMAALLLDIKPGDQVIVPSFTFVSTVNAFVLRGAEPVFIDIRADTLNMNEELLGPLITARTRAILPVHYAGVSCEMDCILAIAKQHGVPVVEDNAHGLFASYKGKPLGTLGCLATQSFHETKNCSCGEGGALVINDGQYWERAEILREKGTNRSRFFRGQVDKYTWVDLGSSYLPSDLLAAFLFAQLEAYTDIQDKRKRVWDFYWANLGEWAAGHGVLLPYVPDHCRQSYHMFYMILPSLQIRQSLIGHLRARGILSVFHYQPLHLSDMARQWGTEGRCPVTERMGDCLLRLPFYNDLTESDQETVIAALREFDGWTSVK